MNIKTGRKLTADEVDTVLGALENLIAITSAVSHEGFANPKDYITFRQHRKMAGLVWSRAIRIIDGEDEA